MIDGVRGPVRRFLNSILMDPDLVDDVEQETFCTLIERYRERFRAKSWKSYALRVAWSKAVKRRRGVGALPVSVVDPGMPEPGRLEELREVVDRALTRLEPQARAMLHLRYEQGHSIRSIARIMGLPTGTVKSRLHHARRELRESLSRDGVERAELLLAALWPLFPSPGEALALERAARTGARWVVTPLQSTAIFVFLLTAIVMTLLREPERNALPEVGGAEGGSVVARVTPGVAAEAVASERETVKASPPGVGARPLLAVSVRTLDGAPVAAAEVRLLGSGISPRAVVTDVDGSCTITASRSPSTPMHHWWLEVAAVGYCRQWKQCVTAVRPTPTTPIPAMTVWLPRPGSARGRVVDEDGVGVAGAEVVVWSSLAVAIPVVAGAPLAADPGSTRVLERVLTDEEGSFVLTAIPVAVGGTDPVPVLDVENRTLAKSFHGGLRICHSHHATTWYAMPVPEKEGAEIDLRLEMTARGSLVGRVVDTLGVPVPGLHLRALVRGLSDIGLEDLADLGPDGPVWRAVTDAEGSYRIDDIPCAQSTPRGVRVVLDGAASDLGAAASVSVTSERVALAPDLVVSPALHPRTLGVHVSGACGRPMVAASAAWIGRRAPRVESGAGDLPVAVVPEFVTGPSGVAVLPARPGGPGPVRVRAPGHGTVVIPRDEIVGEDAIHVELPRAARLRGVVVNHAGAPLAGLEVAAIEADLIDPEGVLPPLVAATPALVSARTRTREDGSFVLEDLADVAYHILLSRPASLCCGLMSPFLAPETAWCEADAEPAGEALEIVLAADVTPPRTRLEVRVEDEDGRAVLHRLEGRLVDVRGEIGCVGVFDGPGRLVFLDARPGMWTLIASAPGFESCELPVEVADAVPQEPLLLRLTPGRRLSGHVLAPPDASDVVVRVLSADGSSRAVVRVDEDLCFAVTGLAEGEWRLRAGGRAADGSPLRAAPVTVHMGSVAVDDIEVELVPTCSFELVLDGLPRSGPERARVLGMVRIRVVDQLGGCWIDRRADGFEVVDVPGPTSLTVSGALPEGVYSCSLAVADDPAPRIPLNVPGNPAALAMPVLPELPR